MGAVDPELGLHRVLVAALSDPAKWRAFIAFSEAVIREKERAERERERKQAQAARQM